MKAVIMAGGKGTRIAEVSSEVPKPMIPIMGKPILEYQIETLKKQGIEDIILVIGHLGHVIMNYFDDGSKVSPCTQEPFGVHLQYIVEDIPMGTAGALYFLKQLIHEDFLLINGDIIFDVDISRFYASHKQKGGLATILTHPNDHPYDSGIIIADDSGKALEWLHKESKRVWYKNRVNAGLHMMSPDIFQMFLKPEKMDLDREVLEPLIFKEDLYVYDSPEYVKDMGTPERYYMVSNDISSGKVSAKNLLNKQRAIFLDRDGTINEYVGFLSQIENFKLKPGVSEAIKMINESGYLAIVITNQPVIARGELKVEELEKIHNKMETLLGQDGAYVDDIFYCPHHPHAGYEGEIPELKIHCDCRKPKPGLFFKAVEKYHIDVSSSWMIGDSDIDIEAGMNAGCKVAYIGEKRMQNVDSFLDLKECVTHILDVG